MPNAATSSMCAKQIIFVALLVDPNKLTCQIADKFTYLHPQSSLLYQRYYKDSYIIFPATISCQNAQAEIWTFWTFRLSWLQEIILQDFCGERQNVQKVQLSNHCESSVSMKNPKSRIVGKHYWNARIEVWALQGFPVVSTQQDFRDLPEVLESPTSPTAN